MQSVGNDGLVAALVIGAIEVFIALSPTELYKENEEDGGDGDKWNEQ